MGVDEDSGGTAQEVSEGSKDCHSGCIIAKNLATFCSYPESLNEAGPKSNGLGREMAQQVRATCCQDGGTESDFQN